MPHTDSRPSLALYYFMHFAAIGAVVPYLALWLRDLGSSASWTGLVVAAPSFAMLATTLALGGWADRLDDRRSAILLCSWSVLALLCVFLVDTSPLSVLLVFTASGVLLQAKQPIIDAMALQHAARQGFGFGSVRLFGSVGFIVALIACGALFERFGIRTFLAMLLGTALLRALAAHALPRAARASTAPRGTSAPVLLRHPGFLLTLAGAAAINASHAYYYTFGLLHWREIGIGTQTGSWLWSAAIVAEIMVMWRFAALARRVSARHCLLFASLAGLLRWSVSATDPGIGWLIVMQTLHAITFGVTFLATVSFIARRIDERHAARAQAVLAVLSVGTMAVATLGSGGLYDIAGGRGYLVMAVLCGLGGLLVLASYRTDLDDVAVNDRHVRPLPALNDERTE